MIRPFTEEEKLIVKSIKKDSYLKKWIADTINRDIKYGRIRVDRFLRKAYILIEKNYYSSLTDTEKENTENKVDALIHTITQACTLLSLLHDHKLIRTDKSFNTDINIIPEPKFSDTHAIVFEITNNTTVKHLIRFIHCKVEFL